MSSDPEPMPGSPDETEGTPLSPDDAATRAEAEAEAEALSQEDTPAADGAAATTSPGRASRHRRRCDCRCDHWGAHRQRPPQGQSQRQERRVGWPASRAAR